MTVRIIEANNMYDLECYINEILSKHHPSEIVDIKYSGSGSHPLHGKDYYSAMIIFEELEDYNE